MGVEKWKNAAVSAVLSFLLTVGGLFCFATGMDLRIHVPTLVLACAMMAVVFSLCFQTKLALLPLGVAALLLGYWWQEGTLRESVAGVIYRLSFLYDRGYGWGVVQWFDPEQMDLNATPALLLLALPVSVATALTAVKGKALWLGALTATLPVAATLLLKDTVPHVLGIGVMLSALVLVLLTGNVRSRDVRQGNRLLLMLALPVAMAVVILFLICPQSTYRGQEFVQKLEEFVVQLFERDEPEQGDGVTLGDQEKTVDLQSVGKRNAREDVIMTVRAEHTGLLYLRGCAYDVYDGTSWSTTAGWNAWSLYYGSGSSTLRKLTVETKQIHSVLYFTYAPFETEQRVVGGRMRNDQQLQSYTMHYRTPISYTESWDELEEEIGGQQLAEYLQLPDSSRDKITNLLTKKIGVPTKTTNAGQVWKNATLIADWVRERADYDLDTKKMPDSQTDFALWFLTEAETGYCTHFATATTVLLRAAGIPAKYVTGYCVEAKSGQKVQVQEANAHAWVEVFVNGIGWVVLDPTPGMAQSEGGQTDTEESQPQETVTVTGPVETVVPTQSTTTEPTTAPVQTEPSTTVAQTQGADATTQTEAHLPVEEKDDGMQWVLLVMAMATLVMAPVAILVQWQVRVAVCRRSMRRGGHNRRAIAAWKLLRRMGHWGGVTPPEEAYWLAQKAAFSRHILTPQELRQMEEAVKTMRARLRSHGWHRRLLYTLVFALY